MNNDKKFYSKDEVLKAEIRPRRWDELPIILGDEIVVCFEWKRAVDMIVWDQEADSYKIVTYPVDHEGLLRNDADIMDWETVIGNYAIKIALTDGCFDSPYEVLKNLYDHVCDDIDVREADKSMRDRLCKYLLYLMDVAGHGFYDNDKEEFELSKAKKLWDWKQK